MKSLIIKCIVMILLALGVSNYLIYIKTGKLPFSLDKIPSISTPSFNDAPSFISGRKEQAYKWTDENGVTHYSSEAPKEVNNQAQIIEVDPDTNLVQGLRMDKEAAPTGLPTGSVYNPKNVKKLMDDAKAVQEKMNERSKQLEGI